MPRTRIPNVSAESPILPFLAPRVFAESPISRSHDRNGKSRRIQQEKDTLCRNELELRAGQTGSTTKDASWGNTTCTRPLHNGQNTAGGLLQQARIQWRPCSSTLKPNTFETRYSDVFLFTRQFIRNYRVRKITSYKSGPQETQKLREHTSEDARRIALRQGRHVPTLRITRCAIPSETRKGSPKAPGVDTFRKPSILNQRGLNYMSLRIKALALEKRRLAACIDYELDISKANLMKNGQYRSLQRRILNLEHWTLTRWEIRSRSSLIRAFAALDRRLYATVGRHTRKVILNHDPRCTRWSHNLFQDTDTQSGPRKVWERWRAISDATSEPIYRGLLIYLLDRKPARAMQFIHVLARESMDNGQKREILADALGHLAKIHAEGVYDTKHGWGDDPEDSKRNFVADFIHTYLQVFSNHNKICSQDLLYNLTRIADSDDLKRLWHFLKRNRVFLGFDTILHYANAFAKAGDISSALGCLEEIRRKTVKNPEAWDALSNRQRLRWTCALILRKSMSGSQGYHETPQIIEAIVGMGIKLDIVLYNVVMHNAMEGRDYSTAFKVYNALEDNGLKANRTTYSIMLHGCTVQDNPAMFTQFAQHCADTAEELQNAWLATDYLYYVYICSQNDSDKTQASARLRQAYLRFFPARSLELLLRNRVRKAVLTTDADTATLNPPPVALYVMLQSRIQEVPAGSSASTHAVEDLDSLYKGFKVLVKRNSEPTLTKLAKNPIIWNAFLLAFCRHQQFASASQLLKDMTDASTQPNIYSWNIFMQAFFKTGQVQAAERVFDIMRTRGVDPDEYTYGVMLRGYARAQHIDRIGEIMQHVGADTEMQPDLLRMLSYVERRDKLVATLEKSRINKELMARENAHAKAESERKRWAGPWSDPLQSAPLTVANPCTEGEFDDAPDSLTAEEAGELNRAWAEAEATSAWGTPGAAPKT
jgi:pentatricopeptide repeat protein